MYHWFAAQHHKAALADWLHSHCTAAWHVQGFKYLWIAASSHLHVVIVQELLLNVQADTTAVLETSALPPREHPFSAAADVFAFEAYQQRWAASGKEPQQPQGQQPRYIHPLYPQPKEDTFPDVLPLPSGLPDADRHGRAERPAGAQSSKQPKVAATTSDDATASSAAMLVCVSHSEALLSYLLPCATMAIGHGKQHSCFRVDGALALNPSQ